MDRNELKLKSDIAAHTAQTAALAPTDYHTFGPLKYAFRGRRFAKMKRRGTGSVHGVIRYRNSSLSII
jgi:hypothetical protein